MVLFPKQFRDEGVREESYRGISWRVVRL